MSDAAATLGGWLAATVAVSVALWAWRARAVTMEAVARASHELRGPLMAVRLGLELDARTGRRSAARDRAIDLELGRAALALDDLVGSGRAPTRPPAEREFEVGALLADAVEASRPGADALGVQLELAGDGADAWIHGDRLRIAQATRNLIANAIEHGGGTVEVCWRADAARVLIEVTDGGAGLPAPVAELTRRARAGRGPRGRGLAIAVAIAADHGGRLRSAPSLRGARLVLELPGPHQGRHGKLRPTSSRS
jgi:signal transduction histidine kinase